ncbi:MAG: metallophosphoesterase [Sphingomicrobium sp.]
MARLIHLSDLHFGAHDDKLVAAVEQRIDEDKPDLVVISGDLTQRARTEEFQQACDFLARLKDKGHEVLAVPGNHDIPLYDVLRRFLSPLNRYKRYIDDTLCPMIDLADVTVLGINTARSLTFKDGHISHEQIDYIRDSFGNTDPGKTRLVVMHHPLFALPVGDGPELAAAMDDSDRALEVLAELGVDLLLAGHNHRASVTHADDHVRGAGTTLVVQAGTATSTRLRDQEQSFNRIEIMPGEVRITIQRWLDGGFASGDSEAFHRDGEHWRNERGDKVEKAPETKSEVAEAEVEAEAAADGKTPAQ